MPFPKIEYCLVCEDFRLERHGLSSLLGFYGVSPEVEILVREIDKPIGRLAFVFLGRSTGGGDCRVSLRIQDSKGKEIIPINEKSLSFPEKSGKALMGFSFTNLKFPGSGEYALVVFVDGDENCRAEFQVSQGSEKDFEK